MIVPTLRVITKNCHPTPTRSHRHKWILFLTCSSDKLYLPTKLKLSNKINPHGTDPDRSQITHLFKEKFSCKMYNTPEIRRPTVYSPLNTHCTGIVTQRTYEVKIIVNTPHTKKPIEILGKPINKTTQVKRILIQLSLIQFIQ